MARSASVDATSENTGSPGRHLARHAWSKLSALLKVLLVTVGSIGAVVLASLIISIIQFQLRLSEARTQNSSITLESIRLITDYQDLIAEKYRTMRVDADQLDELRETLDARLNAATGQASDFCRKLNLARSFDCLKRFQELIRIKGAQISATVIEEYRPDTLEWSAQDMHDRASTLDRVLAEGPVYDAELVYLSTFRRVDDTCKVLLQGVFDRLNAATMMGISPELRMTVEVQCAIGGYTPRDTVAQTVGSLQAVMATDRDQGDSVSPVNPVRSDLRGVDRTLLSELVFYYRFYVWLTSGIGSQIILSPPEFIVILLVIATGILGSFLFHTHTMFLAADHTKFPTFFAIFLRSTLSVMCALVIYILARTGFVAITEGPQRNDTIISPFVIAFMSVAAGLMAERAMQRIRNVGMSALAEARATVTRRRSRKAAVGANVAGAIALGVSLLLTMPDARAGDQPARASCPQGQICGTPVYGLRCQALQSWCSLPRPDLVGTSCFCNAPKGSVEGRVVR